ncbi:hypothetical protein [Xanthomonas pisi]|uniref:hypothetical protein n=1 Tax=Xanthomonas pisi TaxID=56457 RepID=UPI0015E37CE5|nr:hypothetical protein [Xanthomonas pisi]
MKTGLSLQCSSTRARRAVIDSRPIEELLGSRLENQIDLRYVLTQEARFWNQ